MDDEIIPIYYVITERFMIPPNYMNIEKIIKVFSCDLRDIDKLWKQEVQPLHIYGRQVDARAYYREPANPFKELAKEVEKND